MAHANPIQIQKYLKGVDYPATKAELIENAKNLGADENICASLEQLPDEDFQTPAEVSQAFKGPSSDEVEPPTARESEPARQAGTNAFLAQAMEDSLAEIELCVVALHNSANDDIKRFAQTMIDEHGRLGAQIEELAAKNNAEMPKKPRPEHAKAVKALSRLKGEEFDRRFIEQNLRDHENDIKVFEHYAAEESNAALKKLAKGGADMLSRHLKMVKELQKKLGT